MLNQFGDIFKQLTTLTRPKSIDHKIQLVPKLKPIQIKSYRYPYFQKLEIKNLIKEMLHLGVIRISINFFSSLIILVQKRL